MISVCPQNDLQKCYRNLTFDVPGQQFEERNEQNLKKRAKKKGSFQPSVAFDTVPSTAGYSSIDDSREGFKGVPVPNYYTMEECYDDETDSFSPNLQYYLRDTFQSSPFLNTRKENKSESSSFPMRSSKLLEKNSDIKKYFLVSKNGKIVRRDYPSTPVIVNETLMINRFEKNWIKLWRQRKLQINERLNDKKKWFTYPELIFSEERIKPLYRGDDSAPCTKEQKRKHKILQQKVGYPNNPKTIVCHINGKKHTWVALDWTVYKFARNLDHIVVITTLPKLISNRKKTAKDDTEWAPGYQKEVIDQKLNDIFDYILQLVKVVKISVKITLEIIVGKIKKSLVDVINVYTPDFLVLATLKHERNENLITYKSKKLTDVFPVSYPIPTFVVPSKRMYSFELNLQREVNEHYVSKNHMKHEHTDVESMSSSMFKKNTISDISSHISVDSYAEDFKRQGYIKKQFNTSNDSIPRKLTGLAQHSRRKITGDIEKLQDDEKDRECTKEKLLLKKIDIIIRESLKSSLAIETLPGKNVSQSSHGDQISSFKNALIGNGSKNTKFRKSLIPYSSSEEQNTTTTIKLSSSPTSQIKFATSVKHKDGRAALGKARNLPDIRHSISFDKENSFDPSDKSSSVDNSIPLRKVRSAGALRKVKTNDSSSSAGSKKSSSSFSTVNTFTGGGVGIFKVFKSGNSSGNKSSSRRNSSSGDVFESDDRNDKKKKKKKKKKSLFLFGKI